MSAKRGNHAEISSPVRISDVAHMSQGREVKWYGTGGSSVKQNGGLGGLMN